MRKEIVSTDKKRPLVSILLLSSFYTDPPCPAQAATFVKPNPCTFVPFIIITNNMIEQKSKQASLLIHFICQKKLFSYFRMIFK